MKSDFCPSSLLDLTVLKAGDFLLRYIGLFPAFCVCGGKQKLLNYVPLVIVAPSPSPSQTKDQRSPSNISLSAPFFPCYSPTQTASM